MRLALIALVLPLALAAQDRYLTTSPGQPSCPRVDVEDASVHPGSGAGQAAVPSKDPLTQAQVDAREGLPEPAKNIQNQPTSGPQEGSDFFLLGTGKPQHLPLGHRPSAAAFSFTDKSGKTRSVGDLKGKIVIIGFWTTACDASCRELMEMADLQPKGGKFGFEVIPVNFDPERWAKVMPFLQKNPDFFKNTQVYLPGVGEHGPSVLSKVIPALPAVFIVDREGNLAYAGAGYEPNALVAALSRVLKESKPAAQ